MTVRRALDVLALEGLVEPVDKVGVFVRREHRYVIELSGGDVLSELFPASSVSLGDRLLAAYAADGLPLSQTIEVTVTAPPVGVALRLQTNDSVVLRRRVMYAADKRICLASTYVPQPVAVGTDLAQPGLVDLLTLLDRIGGVEEVTEEVFVRPATADESREMRWPTGESLLGQMFTAHTAEQVPLACWVSLMPSGRCILKRRRDVRAPAIAVRVV